MNGQTVPVTVMEVFKPEPGLASMELWDNLVVLVLILMNNIVMDKYVYKKNFSFNIM